jgi:predicted  nucleic acid-binding Zn-ribbon protein
MVDMLCCALGCVIVLWLLNAKQAEDGISEQVRVNASLLASGKEVRADLDAVRSERDRTAKELAAARMDRETANAMLLEVEARLRALEKDGAKLKKDLAGKQEESRTLEARLRDAAARVAALEADARAGAKRLEGEKARAAGLALKLEDAESALAAARKERVEEARRARRLAADITERQRELEALEKKVEGLMAARALLERSLKDKDKELAAARKSSEAKTTTADERLRALEKVLEEHQQALAAANRSITTLRGEKTTLAAEAVRVRAAAEHRFAGIELTGRRVIFLVDTSGSMDMVDEKTAAPEKWKEVCRTVGRLLRSLPDLKQFQVVTFAGKVAYPLGGEDKWINFDPKASADRVEKMLLAIRPEGGTNMHAALGEAFRFRAKGLDTIYLLSDGLPNLGAGLTLEQLRTLKEIERGVVLGKYVRKKLETEWNVREAGRPRVRINTIGFFYESPDLGAFLWALARENDGSFVGMSRP